MNYTRGSEWRKWDLHIHTASSFDYDYKADDADNVLAKALIDNGIAAVAITDHFVIDKARITNLRTLASGITFFPGVELRTDKGDSNIHVSLIFSDLINLDNLVADFEYFRRNIAQNPDDNGRIYWDYAEILKFARKHDAIITVHAGSKSSGLDKKISNALEVNMAIKEEYAQNIDIFEMGKPTDMEGYREHVFKVIGERPMVICSDNHDPRSYSSKLWIKADPTFEGLKQIIYLPEERVFVGDMPPKALAVKNQPYYYLSEIRVKKKAGAKNDTTWFDAQIPLNCGLVAIIGNKGSGKSALADILGYMVNSRNVDDKASFLHRDRFRKEDKRYSDDYCAELSWCGGDPIKKDTLSELIAEAVQYADYLPQRHIDEICNDLKNEAFQDEINRVVFSYIDEAERLETISLSELLGKRTADIDSQILLRRNKLDAIIKTFFALKKRKTQKHKKEISDILAKKKRDLASHDKAKPAEVAKPAKSSASSKELDKLNKALVAVNEEIKQKRTELSSVNLRILNIEQFIAQFAGQERQIAELNALAEKVAKENNIDSVVFSLAGNIGLFHNALKELKAQKAIIQDALDEHQDIAADETHRMLLVVKRSIEEQIEHILSAAAEGDRKYQEYLNNLETWQVNRNAIEGSVDAEGTILFCEAELKYIAETLAADEAVLSQKLLAEVKSIYDLLTQKIDVYKTLYAPIEEKLSKIIQDNNDEIKFETVFSIGADFCGDFLDGIKRTVDSEYKGIQEGGAAIGKRVRECDFSTWESFQKFVEGLIGSLFDNTDKIEQLVKNPEESLAFITKLSYVKVNFSLKMADKSLSELSPGQRGNVLLVFYLALNKKSEPLIIDQPEDNLDNQSVFHKLVPCIIEAKKNRQVIIVTHNPNIAVACDAEQIICAKIEKATNMITYTAGSIENPLIRSQVIDVLEGTMPAFDLRRIKYTGEGRKKNKSIPLIGSVDT